MKRIKNAPFPADMPAVKFCDDGFSESNFRDALADLRPDGFRPMLLIVGPPASGKSVLARWFLRHMLGSHCIAAANASFVSEAELAKEIPGAAKDGFLFLDDLRPRSGQLIDSGVLSSVITAEQWSFRRLGTLECFVIPLNLFIVATAPSRVALSDQLYRRVRSVVLVGGLNSPR